MSTCSSIIASYAALSPFYLTTGPFRPEHAGKMNFYLAALDDLERKPGDNPSIGLILCREHNRVVVEYALRNVDTPIGVARYHAGMADQAVLLLAPVFSETILIPYCWPSAPQNQCGGAFHWQHDRSQ
jgi:hypothetical protein